VGQREASVGFDSKKLEELPSELGGDCLLSLRWRVRVVESFQKSPDGGEKLGAPFEVNGTPFEMTPERRSQVACGIAHSC
jgi:hypothetical protein